MAICPGGQFSSLGDITPVFKQCSAGPTAHRAVHPSGMEMPVALPQTIATCMRAQTHLQAV